MKKKILGCPLVFLALLASLATAAFPSPSAGFSAAEMKPDVKKRITEADVAALTSQLVRIRSDYDEGVAANHKELAAFLGDYLRKLGMEVHVIEPEPGYPTVIGRLKGAKGKPKLGFLGHYNTVMPGDLSKWTSNPFSGEIKDGRVYGLGSSDQKIASGWTWVKVRAKGVTGHTAGVRGDGKPGRPINAIFKLAKVLTEIENFDSWMTYQKHPLFGRKLYDGKPVVGGGKM